MKNENGKTENGKEIYETGTGIVVVGTKADIKKLLKDTSKVLEFRVYATRYEKGGMVIKGNYEEGQVKCHIHMNDNLRQFTNKAYRDTPGLNVNGSKKSNFAVKLYAKGGVHIARLYDLIARMSERGYVEVLSVESDWQKGKIVENRRTKESCQSIYGEVTITIITNYRWM